MHKQNLYDLLPLLESINRMEKKISSYLDCELYKQISDYKCKIFLGYNINSFLLQIFTLVRETSRRVLSERHRNVQIIGGLAMYMNNIVEMKTGEGKTIVSLLVLCMNFLTKKKIFLLTINEYLSNRDYVWMLPVYNFHNIKVSCISNCKNMCDKIKSYRSSIVYGTGYEVCFDFLRNYSQCYKSYPMYNDFYLSIIDEIDSVLIDEARVPLVISKVGEENIEFYIISNALMSKISFQHYKIDNNTNIATFSNLGMNFIERILCKLKISNFFYTYFYHYLIKSLTAYYLLKNNADYIIHKGSILIIDELTGRTMHGKRFSNGIHQSLEIKEYLKINRNHNSLASITFQNYFKNYKKLVGMSGTLITEFQEFNNNYHLNSLSVPRNFHSRRIDNFDQVYKTKTSKYQSVINYIQRSFVIGRPVLVGTISIEASEYLSNVLRGITIPHKLLSAKYYTKESYIISQAGSLGAITIATNMAGRGSDIKTNYNKKEISNLGGLLVIGTERYESRRIDNQLKGRTGRQGELGESIFYISLEDNLMKIFGSEKIGNFLNYIGIQDNESIEHIWVNKCIENAQIRVEKRNRNIRYSMLKFDNIINFNRSIFYKYRSEIIKNKDFYYVFKKKLQYISNINLLTILNIDKFKEKRVLDDKYIIRKVFINIINIKLLFFSNNLFNNISKKIHLIMLDQLWREYLCKMDRFKIICDLRSYEHKNPIHEYINSSFLFFKKIFILLDYYTVYYTIK